MTLFNRLRHYWSSSNFYMYTHVHWLVKCVSLLTINHVWFWWLDKFYELKDDALELLISSQSSQSDRWWTPSVTYISVLREGNRVRLHHRNWLTFCHRRMLYKMERHTGLLSTHGWRDTYSLTDRVNYPRLYSVYKQFIIAYFMLCFIIFILLYIFICMIDVRWSYLSITP